MPFNFRMTLSGLLVLAPDRPFRTTLEPAGSVTVLFPNLLRPRLLEHRRRADQPDILDSHRPFLAVPKNAWREASTRQPDLTNVSASMDLFGLEGEEIEVLPVPGLPLDFTMETAAPVHLNAPSDPERRSLFWLATVEQAAPGRGTLKPGLLADPVGERQPIVARMRLERGRLVTDLLSRRACRFEPRGRNRFEQRVAVRLALEIDDVPSHVSLALKRAGQDTKVLVLAPKDGKSELTVHLFNSELEDVLNPTTQPLEDPERPLADFEVYYDLSRDFRPGEEPRIFLRQIESRSIVSDPPHALCSPTGMNMAQAA